MITFLTLFFFQYTPFDLNLENVGVVDKLSKGNPLKVHVPLHKDSNHL